MRTKWDLGIRGGLDIANPIAEAEEIPAERIGTIIDQALRDMDAKGIKGKEATPYLLGRIVEITGGESLRANIALVEEQRPARRRDRVRVRRAALTLNAGRRSSADL